MRHAYMPEKRTFDSAIQLPYPVDTIHEELADERDRIADTHSHGQAVLGTRHLGGSVDSRTHRIGRAPAFTTSCIRFMIAGTLMFASLYLRERKLPKPTKKEFLWIILLSLVGVVMFNALLFTSLKTITAVRSSVMLAFTPAIVTVAAYFLFKEKLTPMIILGIISATIGAVLTITEGNVMEVIRSGLAIGDLYMIGAVLAWAAYSIIIKLAMTRLSPLALLAYGSAAGVVILIPLTIIEGGWAHVSDLSAQAIWSLLYLSIGAAVWRTCGTMRGSRWWEAQRLRSSSSGTVAAILLGVIVLGEQLGTVIAIGAILVIGDCFSRTTRPRGLKVGIKGEVHRLTGDRVG